MATQASQKAVMWLDLGIRIGVTVWVFVSLAYDHFYIYSHPKALGNAQQRFDAIVAGTNPADPFAERPDIGMGLRAALRGA